MRQIMIITWKWRDWAENMITEERLSQAPNDYWLEHIEEAKDKLFDEYLVGYKNEEDIKMATPEAKVVRLRIKHHDEGGLTLLFLDKLISHYEAPDAELFVFLHRTDGFTDQTIRRLLEKHRNNRYFLFGEGRDYIYYKTQNEGLLGEDGIFFSQKANLKQPVIQVADDKRKLVLQPHFEKVWNHYKHEFYTKIYELKEDLLSHFFSLLPDHFDKPYASYYQHLEKAALLSLRVKSFMDGDCDCFTALNKKNLETYEDEKQKSFVFDDCRANLSRIVKVDDEYDDVAKLLKKLFFGPIDNDPKTLRSQLEELNREFEELLTAINDNMRNHD